MTALDFMELIAQAEDDMIMEVLSRMYRKKNNMSARRAFRILVAAAVAVSLFTALCLAAYAIDAFGIRALLRSTELEFNGRSYSEISISQPQALPEGFESEIEQKLENNRLAWAEWQQFKQTGEGAMKLPEVLKNEPEGVSAMEVDENDDGTYTAVYMDGENVLAQYVMTQEEYDYMLLFMDVNARGYDGYDWRYNVLTDTEAKKLEEIAAKYGLELRRHQEQAFSSETSGQSGDNFYSNAALAAKTADIGCAGNIFYETPAGFDKLYWWNEGTFGVSYYANSVSGGEQLFCYAYNSMYSTLSSGGEVVEWEQDISSFTESKHVAPCGTELSILSNGLSAYIYAYLDNSFYCTHLRSEKGLSDADILAVADYVNYSLIGK